MTSTNRQAKATASVLDGSRVMGPLSVTPHSERIVLVHGSMDRQAGFRRIAKILGDDHAVTSYDRRGYASSAHLGGPYDIERHVDDLCEIVGTSPVVLIGHSFGGTIALAFARRHRELVRGVVVYENPMSWLDWWPSDTGAGRAARHGQDPRAAAEGFLIRFIGQRLWDRLPQATKDARRAEGVALVGELASIQSFAAFDLDRIDVPLVVGVGSLARDYMRRGAELLAESADARLVILDGAHHNAHSARAGEFVDRLVIPLLRRLADGEWSVPSTR